MPSVRLANYSGFLFTGWRRTTVDYPIPAAGRFADGSRFVAGSEFGVGLRRVDVYTTLAPGQEKTLDLNAAEPRAPTFAPAPADLEAFFGGVPKVAGAPMTFVDVRAEGAGFVAELRARVGRMLCVTAFVSWYPDMPAQATAEVIITASNPTVPDLVAEVPAALSVSWGSAASAVFGLTIGSPLMPAGTLADGQARSIPVLLVWPGRLSPSGMATAAATFGVHAVGLSKTWPEGNPKLTRDARAWTAEKWAEAVASLHRWDGGSLGVSPRSGATGAQEDQVFVGAECSPQGAVGAEFVRYLTALRQSARPCHHLELHGGHLDIDAHPNLRMWDGRPHWHVGVSPDRLGKSGGLTEEQAHGWWGPDVEHAFANTLFVAARATGSPALQWQLQAQARVYLFQWTAAPGLSTSQTYAARAVGWEGLLAYQLWHALEDRALAARVRARWEVRADLILVPRLGSAAGDIWDVRVDDPRLGPGAWWLPWQQAVGAYGLWRAAKTFGHQGATAVALRAAKRVVAEAWTQTASGAWVSRAQKPVASGGAADSSFNGFGMPLAVAVVRMEDPSDTTAAALWAWLLAQPASGKWFPPEALPG